MLTNPTDFWLCFNLTLNVNSKPLTCFFPFIHFFHLPLHDMQGQFCAWHPLPVLVGFNLFLCVFYIVYSTFTCLKFISKMVEMLEEMVDLKAYLALELMYRFFFFLNVLVTWRKWPFQCDQNSRATTTKHKTTSIAFLMICIVSLYSLYGLA